ncbi:hypothetical protein EMMF5_004151 [Cystobasidiomycetes sp. EMM_F5]
MADDEDDDWVSASPIRILQPETTAVRAFTPGRALSRDEIRQQRRRVNKEATNPRAEHYHSASVTSGVESPKLRDSQRRAMPGSANKRKHQDIGESLSLTRSSATAASAEKGIPKQKSQSTALRDAETGCFARNVTTHPKHSKLVLESMGGEEVLSQQDVPSLNEVTSQRGSEERKEKKRKLEHDSVQHEKAIETVHNGDANLVLEVDEAQSPSSSPKSRRIARTGRRTTLETDWLEGGSLRPLNLVAERSQTEPERPPHIRTSGKAKAAQTSLSMRDMIAASWNQVQAAIDGRKESATRSRDREAFEKLQKMLEARKEEEDARLELIQNVSEIKKRRLQVADSIVAVEIRRTDIALELREQEVGWHASRKRLKVSLVT